MDTRRWSNAANIKKRRELVNAQNQQRTRSSPQVCFEPWTMRNRSKAGVYCRMSRLNSRHSNAASGSGASALGFVLVAHEEQQRVESSHSRVTPVGQRTKPLAR